MHSRFFTVRTTERQRAGSDHSDVRTGTDSKREHERARKRTAQPPTIRSPLPHKYDMAAGNRRPEDERMSPQGAMSRVVLRPSSPSGDSYYLLRFE